MNNKLHDAMDYISDAHLADAIAPKKRHNTHWLGAVAAAFVLVLAASFLFALLDPHSAPHPSTSVPILHATNTTHSCKPSTATTNFSTATAAPITNPSSCTDSSPHPSTPPTTIPTTASTYTTTKPTTASTFTTAKPSTAPTHTTAKPSTRPSLPTTRPTTDPLTFAQVATAVLPANGSNKIENYDGKTRQALAAITDALLADNAGTNPVCSPLNVYIALAALAETTDGSSRSQILHALGENNLYALRTEAQRIWKDHYANKTYQTLLATSLWIDTGLSYDQSTANALAEYYYSSVYYGDLNANAMESALKDWLDQQTGGLLHDHIQSISLPSDTMLILASTIYYRAQWLSSYQFSKGDNAQSIFHTPDGIVTTTFMNNTLTGHPIFTGENFTATYIPLDDESFMWFILPDVGVDPRSVVNGMNQSPTSENVWIHFSVPKFDITGNQDLSQSLEALGITDVFGPNAEFSIIPGSDAALGANHVARVTIDEKGVEAAAYVLGTIAPIAPAPTKEVDFVLDRPFAFNIVSSSGISLFAGVVNNPTA